MSFFKAENITAGYGKNPIIKNLSFELEEGCLMGILGANGSGKTTLLKAVCGILPHKGICTMEGQVLEQLSPRKLARLCSYIPQRSGISIDIPVLDVVLMGCNPSLGMLERPNSQMRSKAMQALDRVGLSGKEEVNYLQLSEGQKQLCIFARTLVSESRLLLLDEPESALDFRYRYRMMDELKRWIDGTKGSTVVTLHDPVLALNYCDRLLLLNEKEILGILKPKTDETERMERQLSRIYGEISLQKWRTPRGKDSLLIVKEEEG